MSTHSSIFAWRIPKDRGAWGLLLDKKEHSHAHVVCVHVSVCVHMTLFHTEKQVKYTHCTK